MDRDILNKYKNYDRLIRIVKALEPKSYEVKIDEDIFIKIKYDNEAYLIRYTWINEYEQDGTELLYFNTRLKKLEEPIYTMTERQIMTLCHELEQLF